MGLAERFAVSIKKLDTQLGANRAALREYLTEQFSVPFSVVDFTRKVAEQHAAEISRLTAELADEKAVNEHQRSELQDRVQKQRAAEAGLEVARKDAGRYRKWRDTYTSADNTDGVSDDDIMLGALANAWTPEAVDQAIDAALTKEKPQ